MWLFQDFPNLIHPFVLFFFWMLWCSRVTAQLLSTQTAANWIPRAFIGIVRVSVSAVYWVHQSQCWFIIPSGGTPRRGAETLAALWRDPRPIKFPSRVSGQMSGLHLGPGGGRVSPWRPLLPRPAAPTSTTFLMKGAPSDFNYRLIWNATKESNILGGDKHDPDVAAINVNDVTDFGPACANTKFDIRQQ